MTYLGTRPILQDELQKYELHHRARIAIKPGITGMWQVSGRSDITDFEEVVRLDTEYISNWNFGLDIKILLISLIFYYLIWTVLSLDKAPIQSVFFEAISTSVILLPLGNAKFWYSSRKQECSGCTPTICAFMYVQLKQKECSKENKMLKKKLQSIPLGVKAAVVYTMASVFSRGLSMITVPIFTRIMSTSEIGMVNLYNSWYSLLNVIATLSLTSGGFQAAMKDFEGERDQYQSSVLTLTSMMAIVLGCIYFLTSAVLVGTIHVIQGIYINWREPAFSSVVCKQ